MKHKELTIGHAKNHWLKNRKDKDLAELLGNGFPQDDETSIQQGDPGPQSDLSIFYSWQYVQYEKPIWEREEGIPYKGAALQFKHILPGSLVVNYEGKTAKDDGKGRIRMDDNGKLLALVDYKNGQFIIPETLSEESITVSYEYDYEKNQ